MRHTVLDGARHGAISQLEEELIGTSESMQQLRSELVRVGHYDTKVLVTGESGVGKEVIATNLHRLSARAEHPFAAVNCAGLSETLLESELFGHVKGAFTDAYRDKPGKLELADRGTIFLDEIGEMSLRMQGMLLRFMELGELQKVGSDRAMTRVNVRVIAATHRDLRKLVKEGRFREDLFYRLNVLNLHVPPLRERTQDVPMLLDHFLRQFAQHHEVAMPQLAANALSALIAYDWPGNVRELRNVVERLVVSGLDCISLQNLPMEVRAVAQSARHSTGSGNIVVDTLMKQMLAEDASFWNAVYPLFMSRDITREDLRELVRRGLEQSHGSYKITAQMFHVHDDDYKRFLNFLRKHDCHIAFQLYRRGEPVPGRSEDRLDETQRAVRQSVVDFNDFAETRRRAANHA